MITTVLFDVDGTILDTESVIIKSLQQTLKETKNLTIPTHELEYVLGIPGKVALKKFTSSTSDLAYLHEFWAKKIKQFSDEVTVFAGVKKALKQLLQMKKTTGIITSKTTQQMEDEFDRFELNQYFNVFITASDTQRHKPDPEPMELALSELGIQPAEAIYVGDAVSDMDSAQNAGIKFAVANWGAKSHTEFAQADFILETPVDLINLLKK